MFTDADMRIANAAHAERLEEHENGARLRNYYDACANWAANYGRGLRPVIPFAVDSTISYENQFTLTIFETDRRLTGKQPEFFLLDNFKTTSGAQEIGAEFKHMPGVFAFIGTDAYPVDGEVRTANGAQFKFKRGHFAGGYWVKL